MRSATQPANPYLSGCPSRQVLDRIGDRWTVLLLGSLVNGPRRFTELASDVQGISQKMLTQTLRGLERDGLVSRTVYATVPVRVVYELTPLGETLRDPIAALERWATEHISDVASARERYDNRQGLAETVPAATAIQPPQLRSSVSVPGAAEPRPPIQLAGVPLPTRERADDHEAARSAQAPSTAGDGAASSKS